MGRITTKKGREENSFLDGRQYLRIAMQAHVKRIFRQRGRGPEVIFLLGRANGRVKSKRAKEVETWVQEKAEGDNLGKDRNTGGDRGTNRGFSRGEKA